MPATTPVTKPIGYTAEASSTRNWWMYDPEDTPELRFPQSILVYDAMRRQDAQIKSVLQAVMQPVRRTPWRIDPAGAKKKVVELVAEDLGLPIVGQDPKPPPRTRGRFSWDDHLREALTMLPFGFSYFEQVYTVDKGGDRARLHKLELRPARTIDSIEVARDGGLVSILQIGTLGESAGPQRPIPVNQLVAYVNEREGGNWLGQSILRAAYKNWLIKDRLLRVQAQTIERNGMGIPQYTGHDGASPDDLDKGAVMAQALRAGEASGYSLPFGAVLKLAGVEGNLPDADPAIRYHDEQIARAVLAHFLNLGTQTGSWALGTTFADFFTLSLQTLAKAIADTATMHIVEDLVDANFGPEEPAPKIVHDEIGSRQAATAQAIKLLVDAGIIEADDVLEQSTRQQYGLPPKDPDSVREAPSMEGFGLGGEASDAFGAESVAGEEPPKAVAAEAATTSWLQSSTPTEDEDDDDDDGDDLDDRVEAAGKFNPKLHPRLPKGHGGGRFRTTFSRIMRGLRAWAANGGKGDPFEGFDDKQLRRAATHNLGLTIHSGASRKEIGDAFLDHVHETLGGKSAAKKAAKKAPAKKVTPKAPAKKAAPVKKVAPAAKKAVKKAAPAKPAGSEDASQKVETFMMLTPMSSQPDSLSFAISYGGVDIGAIHRSGKSGDWTAFPPNGAEWGLQGSPGTGESYLTQAAATDALVKAHLAHLAPKKAAPAKKAALSIAELFELGDKVSKTKSSKLFAFAVDGEGTTYLLSSYRPGKVRLSMVDKDGTKMDLMTDVMDEDIFDVAYGPGGAPLDWHSTEDASMMQVWDWAKLAEPKPKKAVPKKASPTFTSALDVTDDEWYKKSQREHADIIEQLQFIMSKTQYYSDDHQQAKALIERYSGLGDEPALLVAGSEMSTDQLWSAMKKANSSSGPIAYSFDPIHGTDLRFRIDRDGMPVVEAKGGGLLGDWTPYTAPTSKEHLDQTPDWTWFKANDDGLMPDSATMYSAGNGQAPAPAKAAKKAAKKAVPPSAPPANAAVTLKPSTGKFEILDDPGKSGDGYSPAGHWGKYGAAGALIRAKDGDGVERFLLIQRNPDYVSTQGGMWQLPGGAKNENEDAYQGAAREIAEETKASKAWVEALTPRGESVFEDHADGWQYTTIAADADQPVVPVVDGQETSAAKWVTRAEIETMIHDGEIVDHLDTSILGIIDSMDTHNAPPAKKAVKKATPAKPATPNEPDVLQTLLDQVGTSSGIMVSDLWNVLLAKKHQSQSANPGTAHKLPAAYARTPGGTVLRIRKKPGPAGAFHVQFQSDSGQWVHHHDVPDQASLLSFTHSNGLDWYAAQPNGKMPDELVNQPKVKDPGELDVDTVWTDLQAKKTAGEANTASENQRPVAYARNSAEGVNFRVRKTSGGGFVIEKTSAGPAETSDWATNKGTSGSWSTWHTVSDKADLQSFTQANGLTWHKATPAGDMPDAVKNAGAASALDQLAGAPKVTKPKVSAAEKKILAGDFSDLKQVSGAKGSNPGGIYEASDGTRWYVKQQKSTEHGQNEALAAALYEAAGVDVPRVIRGSGTPGLEGGGHTATKLVEGATSDLEQKLVYGDPAYLRTLHGGYAVDAWLANWDVAGLTFDNVVTGADGKPHRIDVGGSLLFRAQGGEKGAAFGPSVGEWDSLRDAGSGPQAAKAFAGITTKELLDSAERVKAITPAKIRSIVKAHGLDPSVADTLIARRADLLSRAKHEAIIHPVPPLEDDDAKSAAPLNQGNVKQELQKAGLAQTLADRIKHLLDLYQDGHYREMNEALYKAGLRKSNAHYEPLSAGRADEVAAMDEAFKRSRLKADVIVYRGTSQQNAKKLFGKKWSPHGGMEGATWIGHGYASTSTARSVAENFAGGSGSGGVVFKIRVPKGTRTVDMQTGGGYGSEREMLLTRGLKYRVVKDLGMSSGYPSVRVLEVEVVNPVRTQTVVELLALAKQRGISIPGDAKKADILKLLGLSAEG